MNKFNLLLTAAAVVFSTPAMARNSDGGFVDVNVITVEEAKNMNDDAYVILQGYITDRNGDEKYVFQDLTASADEWRNDGKGWWYEIDDDDWDGVDVSPADLVEIQGKIDKGWTAVEIDVDTISKVAPQMKNNAAAAK